MINKTTKGESASSFEAGCLYTFSDYIFLKNLTAAAAGETGLLKINPTTGKVAMVTGNIEMPGTVTAHNFIIYSSREYKENLKELDNMEWVDDIRLFSFNMKNDPEKTLRYGAIAEEVEQIAPEMVSVNPNDGKKSIAYIDLLVAKIARLEEKIKNLESRL